MGGTLDIGTNVGTWAKVRLGYRCLHRATDMETGPRLLPEGDHDDAGVSATVTYDSRSYWTTSGSYLWKLTDIMTIRSQALYAGVRVQAGRIQAGPLTVGVGATSSDAWSLWLAIGRPIGHGTILERGVFR